MIPERRRNARPSVGAHGFRYSVFGLKFLSAIEFPELLAADFQKPDVILECTQVPSGLDRKDVDWGWCQANRSEMLLLIDGVGRFHVCNGETIRVDRRNLGTNGLPDSHLRLWVLGSCFAAILHQRASIPLHASAIEMPSGIWAFTADSGVGKSTIAAFLTQCFSVPLVTDDVLALELTDQGVAARPGPRKIKLTREAIDCFAYSEFDVRSDLPQGVRKSQVYLPNSLLPKRSDLRNLVLLETSEDPNIVQLERLGGIQAFEVIQQAVHRPYMSDLFQDRANVFESLRSIHCSVRVFRFTRPHDLERMAEYLGPLISLLERESNRNALDDHG